VSITKKLHSLSKTKVITITSGKGGVGKSTLTANIAYLLSKKNLKIAVLDADIGLANLQILFNIKPKKTLFDYLNGNSEIDEILLDTQYQNLTLVAGKSDYKYSKVNNSMVFTQIVEEIVALNRYDLLLIDTGAGINEYVQEFLELTDNILAITTTDPSALTDLYALLKMMNNKKTKLMLCFNFTLKYDTGEAITKSIMNLAIKNKLNRKFMLKYIGNIQETKSISSTSRLRKLFSKEFKGDIVVNQLDLITKRLLMEIGL
jgi:flagellar biosynthesis protein FlhG